MRTKRGTSGAGAGERAICWEALLAHLDLCSGGHGGVAGEGGQQRAVRPPQVQTLLGSFAVQQSVEKSCADDEHDA